MPVKWISLLLLISCLGYYYCAAQTGPGAIRGSIRDMKNAALDGATVTLMLARDSSTQQTMIAARGGQFVFKDLPVGTYLVRGSFIGYNSYTSGPVMLDARHLQVVLPVIVLGSAHKQTLQDVVINARKKLVEHRIDRTIINVESMISAAGGNAIDVLARSPGVRVDINGDINLYGKGGVLVLIDDRPTYLSVQDLAAYLRSLPADLLDKLELMSPPPAKYDAAGSAVINIVLKKNRAAGFNGTAGLAYNQGLYAKSNSSLNLNYRTAKMNLFGNLGYSADRNFNDDTYNRYYYNPDQSPSSTLLISNRYRVRSEGWNLRAGMDYFVSPKTTLGVLLTGNVRPKKDRQTFSSDQYDGSRRLDSMSNGYTDGNYHWNGRGINLNGQHKLDSAGATLSADLDYITYHSEGDQFANSFVYGPDGSLANERIILNQSLADIRIYSAKADYTQPLPGKARYDMGVKTSFVTTDNNINWFNQQDNVRTPDYTKTNHFIYRENINAFYASATKEWQRWGIQAGMRLENTRSEGRQVGNPVVPETAFTRNYTNLFPTIYLSYKLDPGGDNIMRITYERRIRRPNYQQLNPFLMYRDKYSYSAGNPDLRAHYNNFVELSYRYRSVFGFSVWYGWINNLIQPLTEARGDTLITSPRNFGTDYSVNFRPYISISPVKGWDLNGSGILFYLTNKGSAFGQLIDNKVLTCELEVTNQFRFGRGWSGEFIAFWGSPHKGGQSIARGGAYISAGIQKSILGNNGTLRLKIDDILYSRVRRDNTIGLPNMMVTHRGTADTRVVGLSFNYRFGKAANARKRNKNAGGASDEQGRAN